MIKKNDVEFFSFDFDIDGKPMAFVVRANKTDSDETKKTLEAKLDWSRDKENNVNPATHSVAWKSKGSDWNEKVEVTGSAAKYEREMNPKSWNSGDLAAGLKFKGESKPSSKTFKWTTQARLGFPKITPDLGLYTNWTVNCGSIDPTGSASFIANFQKNYNFGVVGGLDLKSKELKSIDVVGTAQINSDLYTYFKYGHTSKTLKIGATHENIFDF